MNDAIEISTAYDGSDATFRLLRASDWGPVLMNLGYFPYFGPLTPLNWFYPLVKAQKNLTKNAIALLDVRARDDVLDVACGRGFSSFHLALENPSARISAIDLLPEHVATAQTLFAGTPNLQYQVGSAMELPFDNESFDRVLCVEAAFHFPDRALFLSEARRVLRRGGRLVVVDFVWNSADDRREAESEPFRYVRKVWQWDDFYTLDDYRRAAAAAGLELRQANDWTRRVTKPLQTLFEIAAWLGRRSWGRKLLVHRHSTFSSLSGADWEEIDRSVRAHRAVRARSQYRAMVFEPAAAAPGRPTNVAY